MKSLCTRSESVARGSRCGDLGVCSLKCQNETAEITLLNTVDRTRRVKTIPRDTTRYSHDSLGHRESSIKEVEKQIRVFISHTWRADHKCDSDRHVAWTITQRTVNAEEQTSLSKWMSKDYRGEVAKFAELSWFQSIAKQQKLSEQWKNAHWVGKLKRADEQLLVIRGLTRSVKMKSGIWTVLNRIQEWKSTEIDTSVDKQKYITNQVLDEHSRTPLCTKCAWDTGAHCRARFEITWTEELAEALNSMLSSPDVKEIESLKSTGATGQNVAMEVNTTDESSC